MYDVLKIHGPFGITIEIAVKTGIIIFSKSTIEYMCWSFINIQVTW